MALTDADRQAKDEAKASTRELFWAFYTQDEIAATIDWPQPTIAGWLKELIDFGKFAKSAKAKAEHAVDFETPICGAGL